MYMYYMYTYMYLCLFVSIIESQYNIPVGWIPQQTSVDGLQLVGELQQYTNMNVFQHNDIYTYVCMLVSLQAFAG